jgi:hypothetical protein
MIAGSPKQYLYQARSQERISTLSLDKPQKMLSRGRASAPPCLQPLRVIRHPPQRGLFEARKKQNLD